MKDSNLKCSNATTVITMSTKRMSWAYAQSRINGKGEEPLPIFYNELINGRK